MIITISRSYGSGGKEVGKALAKMLGVKYYGREIFEMLGGGETVDDESIHEASLEEADAIFNMQSKLIRDIADKEDCVIVGRCADYVLRDTDGVINVHLYAPLRNCMRRIMRLYELNPEDAKSLIHSMNKTRRDYYMHNTGKEWSDSMNYDFCLSTAGLTTEQCAEMIKNYIEARK